MMRCCQSNNVVCVCDTVGTSERRSGDMMRRRQQRIESLTALLNERKTEARQLLRRQHRMKLKAKEQTLRLQIDVSYTNNNPCPVPSPTLTWSHILKPVLRLLPKDLPLSDD